MDAYASSVVGSSDTTGREIVRAVANDRSDLGSALLHISIGVFADEALSRPAGEGDATGPNSASGLRTVFRFTRGRRSRVLGYQRSSM